MQRINYHERLRFQVPAPNTKLAWISWPASSTLARWLWISWQSLNKLAPDQLAVFVLVGRGFC